MSIFKKVLNHSFWLLIGTIIGRSAMFLINIFAARILNQEIFGQFTMVRSTISLFEGLVSGTLNTTATKKIAEVSVDKADNTSGTIVSLFLINILFIIVISIILLIFSDWIIESFFLSLYKLKKALYLGIFLLFASTFSSLTQSVLIGLEQFRKLAYLSLLATIISIPLILFLIYFYRLYGAFLSVIIYFLVDFLFKFNYLSKYVNLKLFTVKMVRTVKEIRHIIFFSSPIFFSVLINSTIFWYSRVLLINESKNFEKVAIFDAAYQWLTIIMLITGATTRVALPMFSKAFGIKDQIEMNKIFIVNVIINICISSVIAFLFIYYSHNIMYLYGKEYVQGFSVLKILSVTSIFFTVATLMNRYMMSINLPQTLLIASILSSMAMYIVYLMYGITIEGLAYSFMCYYGVSVIYYCIVYINNYKGIIKE